MRVPIARYVDTVERVEAVNDRTTVSIWLSKHWKAGETRRYRARHPKVVDKERNAAAQRAYKSRLSPEKRAQVRERADRYRALWRSRYLMFLGGRCERCGNNDSRVLQVDHVYGGGKAERKQKLNRNAKHVAIRIWEQPSDYQILCANCNFIKAFEQERPTKENMAKRSLPKTDNVVGPDERLRSHP